MTIDAFITASDFNSKSELERVRLFAFYIFQVNTQEYFTMKEVCDFFHRYGFGKPNLSRLKDNMAKKRWFVRGQDANTFRLHNKEIENLKKEFPDIDSKSEEIVTDETILPDALVHGTRGYIINLAKQINASYHYNIFDGCAILMRRLLEILLVQSYIHLGRKGEIEDGDGLKNLSYIINYTLSNKVISLHKDSVAVLDTFRELGNLSAHRVEYNAKRIDIANVKVQYRAVIEELLYASSIKK